MKRTALLVLILALTGLSGCSQYWDKLTGKQKPKTAFTVLPPHENWCYGTLAAIECYPGPQRLPPETLVSVDPPSKFPLTREDHAKALRDYQNPPKKGS